MKVWVIKDGKDYKCFFTKHAEVKYSNSFLGPIVAGVLFKTKKECLKFCEWNERPIQIEIKKIK